MPGVYPSRLVQDSVYSFARTYRYSRYSRHRVRKTFSLEPYGFAPVMRFIGKSGNLFGFAEPLSGYRVHLSRAQLNDYLIQEA